MISDDKRRKAAANLRSLDDEAKVLIVEQMHKLTYEEIDASLVLMLGLFVAVDAAGLEMKQSGNFWDLLADLIDCPTCKNLATKSADELLCSECGEHVDIAYMENADDYHARYCPNCGAKVVTDDD